MLAALALIAAAVTTPDAIPAPPPVLVPYVRGTGGFDPGDYGWMRGMFEGATAAQIADWQAIDAWRRQCRVTSYTQVRRQLIAAGIAAPAIHTGAYGDALCGAVDMAIPQGDVGRDWPTFQTKLTAARRVADTLVWSASLAQAVGDDGDRLAAELEARPITDQVLRMSLSWNEGEQKGAPPLDPMEGAIVRGLTWSAIRTRDHANTAWMKTVVTKHGWPTIAMVGPKASANAWLLVQHADDDPVFQLAMLRLMEPLAAKGQIGKKNYAMLHDRVMLQMTGRQRYGTQWTCQAGKYRPRPLEDPAKVDGYRRQADLDTLAQNATRIDRLYGPCPPAATKP